MKQYLMQKGITLVSLVITIIIMLIIAGVGINQALSSDGIISKAKEAVEKWENAALQEELIMNEIMPTFPDTWDSDKIAAKVIGKNRIAPIPQGFVASKISGENSIEQGLVIYEGTAEVAGEKNSQSHTNAMTSRNQYVWIPVDDINQMVMCKLNNKDNNQTVCNLVLEKDNSGEYVLRCKKHNPNGENTTEVAGRIYIMGNVGEGEKITFDNRLQKWDNSRKEPATVSSDTSDNMGDLNEIVNDFEKMAISVARYGGFYVARYEAGANGSSKKNQEVITAAVDWNNSEGIYAGVNGWHGLYNTLNRTVQSSPNIQGHMIYGSQYDQIIKFLDENEKNEPQIAHQNRQEETQGPTGSNAKDVMSNIYDLEGNNRELTAQADGENRASRGSSYVSTSNDEYYSAIWMRTICTNKL